MYADDIKAILVSALLPRLTLDEVLGSEVRFGDGRYRADLVISSPSRLSAIEIKGPRDNLDKLTSQSEGYSSSFLEFSVAADSHLLPAVREKVSRYVGLISFKGTKAEVLRAPRTRRRLAPEESLKWLRTEDLKELLRKKSLSASGHNEMLRTAAKLSFSSSELSDHALNSVYCRLLPRFNKFRDELGRIVTLDDVRMLTLNDQIGG